MYKIIISCLLKQTDNRLKLVVRNIDSLEKAYLTIKKLQ